MALFNPEAIFLFGGPVHAGRLLFEPTQKAFDENLVHIYKGTVRILPSELLNANVAVLGASALAWKLQDTEVNEPSQV